MGYAFNAFNIIATKEWSEEGESEYIGRNERGNNQQILIIIILNLRKT